MKDQRVLVAIRKLRAVKAVLPYLVRQLFFSDPPETVFFEKNRYFCCFDTRFEFVYHGFIGGML